MIHRRMPPYLSAIAFAFASTAIQCSTSRTEFEEPREAAAPDPFLAPLDAGDAPVDAGAREECSGTNSQIYVLSRSPDAIARFDPATLTFTRLGYIPCAAAGPFKGVFSMAVDRYNTAWIVFSQGKFIHVDLDDLSCRDVILRKPYPDLIAFGMGFSKNDQEPGETLFLWKDGLYKVDPANLEVEWVGQTRLPYSAELTGTGDGRLFAFTPYNGALAHLDKTTGDTLEAYRTSAVNAGGFAFAQWGGDFWLFTSRGDEPSSVTRYSPESGESTVVLADTGIHIVGAGSSTCAPFRPVQ